MEKIICQIEYTRQSDGMSIHSDINPKKGLFSNIDAKYKKLLHECLNEWLENSNGTGAFRIYQEGTLPDVLLSSDINRVEVIDEKGRSYVNWKEANKVELVTQDKGKTLKIFIEQRED